MKRFKAAMLVNLFLIMIAIFSALNPVNGSDSIRKLDEEQGGDEKCTPCVQNPPPPPPPSPCPPPPSPPPPPPKKPPSPPSPTSGQYCPPPPAPFIYITGPPGNLYPVDPDFDYNASAPKSGLINLPIFLVACGLLGVLAFW